MNAQYATRISCKVAFLAAMTLLTFLGGKGVSEASLKPITINKPLFGSYTTSGLPVTNYRQVDLRLNPPVGTSTMSFRNESGTWSTPETATTSKQWTLSEPDADKTVSVTFRNGVGAVLGTYSDKTRLDYIIDTAYLSPKGANNYANTTYTNFGTTTNAIAVQPADQKIVVVGTDDSGGGNTKLRVIRYNPDGTPDTSFGAGTGTVWYGNTTGSYVGNAVAIQSDGKIVVVGTYELAQSPALVPPPIKKTGVWIMRLTSTGDLDPTFNASLGGGYRVESNLTRDTLCTGNAVTLQPDGKIVVVGTYDRGGAAGTAPWVLRFNSNGSPDTTFNSTGDVIISSSIAGPHSGNAVALDASGRIVVVGTYRANGSYVWGTRLNTNGQLDATFGSSTPGNVFYGNVNSANSGNSVAINNSTGKINIVGTWDWSDGDTDAWLLQLNSNGTLDSTFNPEATGFPPGSVAFGGAYADIGNGITIQADGKILVVGTYDSVSETSLLVERFNSDSSYDTTFNRGNSSYSYGAVGGFFSGKGAAIQSDQKIVVAGAGFGSTGSGVSKISYTTMLSLRLFDRMYPLTVSTIGSGTVSILPGDVTWNGTTGSATYVPGTLVQLTAVPAGGGTFIGWSGACTGTGACTVTMDAAKDVTATFSLPVDLAIHITGAGSVATDQPGFACSSSNCSASFPLNTTVNLTAVPSWYSQFGSWSGCDNVVGPVCTVTMSSNRTVSAVFNQNLTVRLVGKRDYATLHDGYVAADASGMTPPVTLQAQAVPFFENLLFDLPVNLLLEGGKDAAFSTLPVGLTTISGSLIISNGKVITRYLAIKPQ